MADADRDHFDRISDRYEQARETWSFVYERVGPEIDALVAGREVLDIGSGGEFAYDASRPARVIALDVSPAMLDAIRDARVEKRLGDARDLRGFADASLDVVVFALSLHHMAGTSPRDSAEALGRILASARRVLRPGGHVVVLENLVRPWLFRIECWLFPLTRRILASRDVPMIFFWSLPVFRAAVEREFESVRELHAPVEGRIDPLGGSFPGIITLPAALFPSDYWLVTAQAPEAPAARP